MVDEDSYYRRTDGGAGRRNRVRTKLNTELCRSQHSSIPHADTSSHSTRGATASATTRASTRSSDNASTDFQPARDESGSSAGGTRIAPGSVIPVQLTKTIDAKKAKVGDPVMAKVTMDLKTNSGELLVPKDTKVTGHVTEAQARSKDQKESQLGIAFDHATLKSGDVSLPMSIQAVIAPPSNDANSRRRQRRQRTCTGWHQCNIAHGQRTQWKLLARQRNPGIPAPKRITANQQRGPAAGRELVTRRSRGIPKA